MSLDQIKIQIKDSNSSVSLCFTRDSSISTNKIKIRETKRWQLIKWLFYKWIIMSEIWWKYLIAILSGQFVFLILQLRTKIRHLLLLEWGKTWPATCMRTISTATTNVFSKMKLYINQGWFKRSLGVKCWSNVNSICATLANSRTSCTTSKFATKPTMISYWRMSVYLYSCKKTHLTMSLSVTSCTGSVNHSHRRSWKPHKQTRTETLRRWTLEDA